MKNGVGMETIIVTGAAGGIGAETLPLLASPAHRLIAVDIPGTGDQMRGLLKDLPGEHHLIESPLEDFDACRAVVREAGGRVAGLVHLAGVFETDPDGPANPGVWERAIAHNLTNAYNLAGACAEARDPDVVARFVFISSLAFRRGSFEHVPYAAAKGGLVGLVRALSRRHAPDILVNGLAPGLIDTKMPAEIISKRGEQLLASIPLKRFGHPHEVATVIGFLMSDAASYVTGQIINVDGGIINS